MWLVLQKTNALGDFQAALGSAGRNPHITSCSSAAFDRFAAFSAALQLLTSCNLAAFSCREAAPWLFLARSSLSTGGLTASWTLMPRRIKWPNSPHVMSPDLSS